MRHAVAIFFALIMPIYGQKKGPEPAAHQHNTAGQAKAPPPVSPGIVNVINQDASKQQQDGSADHPKTYFERLASPENLPNIGLFGVGVAGIIVAILTLRKIRNQADLMERQAGIMERQAALMEAPFDQWVELRSWKAEKFKASKMTVTVDLVNPTSFLMSVSGQLTIQNMVYDGASYWLPIGTDRFLAPNNPILIGVDIDLTLDQQTVDSIDFPVSGEFTYLHRTKKSKTIQPFEGVLRCYERIGTEEWTTEYVAVRHMNPEPHNGNTDPN